MDPDTVVSLGRGALELMLVAAAPVLGVALVVGLVISFLQAITQINEATLSFLPKLLAVGATLVIVGPWMVSLLTDYIRQTLTQMATFAS